MLLKKLNDEDVTLGNEDYLIFDVSVLPKKRFKTNNSHRVGTNGSQLYIDDTTQVLVNTAFSNHIRINELTNIALNKNQVVTVRARARGTSCYMYVSNFTIQQTA